MESTNPWLPPSSPPPAPVGTLAPTGPLHHEPEPPDFEQPKQGPLKRVIGPALAAIAAFLTSSRRSCCCYRS